MSYRNTPLRSCSRFLRRPLDRRGFTLVETTVSIAVTGFIIAFVGYLIFMATINAYNIHDQVLTQTSASNAAEKVTSLLREATSFAPYEADEGVTPLSRVLFMVPPPATPATAVTTSALCFKPGEKGEPGEIWYFEDERNVTYSSMNEDGIWIPSGRPTRRFSNIRSFEIFFESDFQLELSVGFDYRGFAFVFKRPEEPMVGRFTTQVIARNHYLPYGPNGHPELYEDSYDENVTTNPVML